MENPFEWVEVLEWHQPAHRAVMASVKLGGWLAAALDDPDVCDAMKADISEWFSAGEPMEVLGQALDAAKTNLRDLFAGQCIAGTNPGSKVSDTLVADLAIWAYRMADAMMSARSSHLTTTAGEG